MSAESSHLGPALKPFPPGAPVVVRSSFEGSWCPGFEIAEIVRDVDGVAGHRLRGTADRTLLPAVFPVGEVIPAGR